MINKTIISLFILLSAMVSGSVYAEVGVMKFPKGEVQHVVLATDIKWKSCPPHLPKGCEMMVLEGSPKKPDLFTVRFKADKSFLMPSHTHPKDERVTILSGKVSVGFGKGVKHKDATHFGSGDYYVNKRGAVHTVWVDEPAILQITGIGPWEVHFLDKSPKKK